MALFSEFFGGQPKVPKFVPVDPQAEQLKAIAGNQAALPSLFKLAETSNAFTDQVLTNEFPNWGKVKNTVSSNIYDWTKGIIPQDVQDSIQRSAAAKSLGGGYAGGGMGRNLVARDLGLTSLDLMNRGMDAASRWLAGIKSTYTTDVSNMFITPQQQIALATEERNAKFQRDYIKNQWDWYGSFGQQATRFEDTLTSLASSIGGSMMGGA